LRRRLVKCLIALAIGLAVCIPYAANLIVFLNRPALKAGVRLFTIEGMEIFSVYFNVALAGSICLAAPIILWQAWRFIEPGLYRHEKRYAVPFMISTCLCFAAGAAFGYGIVAPWLLKLQVAMAEKAHIELAMSSRSYLATLTNTILAMGAIFEMPPVIFILSRIGLVSAKFLIVNFKYAFLFFSVAAAVLTPSTDMPPMLAFMAVMTAVYAVSILVALVFGKARKAE
jgi:sec-independent protein translocase protein TatC